MKLSRTTSLLLEAPLLHPLGLWSPRAQRKQKTKSHLCLFLHYCSWQPQHENPPEALWGFAELKLRPASKERIPSIFIKQNRIKEWFWSTTLYLKFQEEQNPVLERKANLVVITHKFRNSGNFTWSAHSVKISPLAPDKSLSPCLLSLVWRADNVSFVCFGNSKHNIFWSRSPLLVWLCKAPVSAWIEVRGQWLTAGIFSWHRRQRILQDSHPDLSFPFSHSSTKQP